MLKRGLVYKAIMIIAITAMGNSALAAGIESLVMPGPLVQGHAKYEEDCSNCHQPFSKKSQDSLCTDCHEKIRDDISAKRGYHGRSMARRTTCKHCHTDHEGRNADIIRLGIETFDHDNTDYPLKGAHTGISCNACHAHGKKYRDAPGSCIDCHRKDDIHKEQLGDDCSDCHNERSWRKQKFNHDDTNYRLQGKHVDVDCNSCHVSQRYKGTASDCYSCHRLNDVHTGRYGARCEGCHSEKDWARVKFDHAETDFPLAGKHRKVQCASCHTADLKKELETSCIACHTNDDEHGGRYGRKCESCHSPAGWGKIEFSHSDDTKFPLLGKHKDIQCELCHRGELATEDLKTSCFSCHAPDDVHKGQEGEQCDTCHSASGWSEQVRFDHAMSGFPLNGMHAATPCEECHLTAVYKAVASSCNDCHREDDVHKQRLGLQCENCHNPNGWSLWEFDHNQQTDFVLDGAHEGLDCLACHSKRSTGKIHLSSACDGCHREDDIHDGRFGRYCERCHDTSSFDAVEIR